VSSESLTYSDEMRTMFLPPKWLIVYDGVASFIIHDARGLTFTCQTNPINSSLSQWIEFVTMNALFWDPSSKQMILFVLANILPLFLFKSIPNESNRLKSGISFRIKIFTSELHICLRIFVQVKCPFVVLPNKIVKMWEPACLPKEKCQCNDAATSLISWPNFDWC
jgi:hypothetical protein